jgi:hypothetical protein
VRRVVDHELGVDRRLGRSLQLGVEKGDVKARVVRDERWIADER